MPEALLRRTRRQPLLSTIRRLAPSIVARAGLRYDPLLLAGLEDRATRRGHDPDRDPEPDRDSPRDFSDLVRLWLERHPDRRRAGLYLTPYVPARALLEQASRDGDRHTGAFRPRTILDPAVGAGVFLRAAIDLFGPNVQVWGIDIDPIAVALCRLAVRLAGVTTPDAEIARRIRCADALLDLDPFDGAAPPGGFDLVCGNPPFGNAIERRTARSAAERARLRAAFPETAHGPYDRSTLFVDLAARRLRNEGRYALLVPRALLAARYATGLRGLLSREAPLRRVVRFERDAPVPECEIHMVGWIGARESGAAESGSPREGWVEVIALGDGPRSPRRARPDGVARFACRDLPPESWGALCLPEGAEVLGGLESHPRVRDYFEVRASATVAEAYAFAGQIREAVGDDEGCWKFVTAGLIAPYRSRWGEAPARFLGRRFERPALPRDTAGLADRRARLYDDRKVIVAGLSRHVEAFLDAGGRFAGSVGTLAVVARDQAPLLLARAALLLNSRWISSIHRARRGPLALAGGSIPLGRRDLEELPFPATLDGPAAAPAPALLAILLRQPDHALPTEPEALRGILDAAGEALLAESSSPTRHVVESDPDPDPDPDPAAAWDALVQQVIDRLRLLAGDAGPGHRPMDPRWRQSST